MRGFCIHWLSSLVFNRRDFVARARFGSGECTGLGMLALKLLESSDH